MQRITFSILSVIALASAATPSSSYMIRSESSSQTINPVQQEQLNAGNSRWKQEHNETLNARNSRAEQEHHETLNARNPRAEQEHHETLNS